MSRFYLLVFLSFFSFRLAAQACLDKPHYQENLVIANFKGKSDVYRLPWNELSKSDKKDIYGKGGKLLILYPDGTALFSLPSGRINELSFLMGFGKHKPQTGYNIAGDVWEAEGDKCIVTSLHPITPVLRTYFENDLGLSVLDDMEEDPYRFIIHKSEGPVQDLAKEPYIIYIEVLEEDVQPLSDRSIALQGVTSVIQGPDGLSGEGVVVGVGDGGILGNHIDFNGRIHNEAETHYTSYGAHPDVISGIIAGQGNINPKYQGIAPASELVIEQTFRIHNDLAEFFPKYGMVLTNNSYGSSFSCTNTGSYQYNSAILDQKSLDYPEVLHLFAAGNNGTQTCGEFPQGYGTILKSYAVAKNVLTVGGANHAGLKTGLSSAGPSQDGRIKPEVIANGLNVWGPNRNYGYGSITGTSTATAGATGTLALLYEKYRLLNEGNNPKAALMKAVVCNTAEDKGNAGPDFQHGFGLIDAEEAVEVLENGTYGFGNMNASNETHTFTFTVEPGMQEARFMLYWHDEESYSGTLSALVNDLDIKVTAPDGTEYLPWVLDPAATGVESLAQRGEDHTNNIEQVTLSNPDAGVYTITVSATNLNNPGMEFVVTYHQKEEEFQVVSPAPGYALVPGDEIVVSWDWNKSNTSTFTLEYGYSPSGPWMNIGSSPSVLHRSYVWAVPSINRGQVYLKLKSDETGEEVVSEAFSVRTVPEINDIIGTCADYLEVSWGPVEEAVSYEVFLLGEKKMESVGTTSEVSFQTRVPSGKAWLAVKAIFNDGTFSQRSVSVEGVTSQSYPCPWEDDIRLVNVSLGPTKGRNLTSTMLSNATLVNTDILNAGNNPVSGYSVTFRNGTEEFTETINQVIEPGQAFTHTFSETFDFSTVGIHDVEVMVELIGDTHNDDEEIAGELTQIGNNPVAIPLEIYYNELPNFTVEQATIGLPGMAYADFATTGMGKIGLDPVFSGLMVENEVITEVTDWISTFNLSDYGSQNIYLRLEYLLKWRNNTPDDLNVYLRGKDTDEWIQLDQLEALVDFSVTPNYNLTRALADNGQSFSSSSQIKVELRGGAYLNIASMKLLDDASILPVEMVYFRATKMESDVLLEWKTASEENNDFFEIQVAKGEDALDSGDFGILGTVSGQGTTPNPHTYYFDDRELFKTGIRYYRLRQVDYDGTESYTPVIPVLFDVPSVNFKVFPNPVMSGEVPKLYLDLEEDTRINIVLSDISGKVLFRLDEEFSAGQVTMPIEWQESWPPGVYYLSGYTGGRRLTQKIIKIED